MVKGPKTHQEPERTHLSTESNVFFKGGGRSLGFFTGPSFLSEDSGSDPPADLPASPGEPPILLDPGGGTGEDGGGGAGAAGEGSKRLSGSVPFQSIEYYVKDRRNQEFIASDAKPLGEAITVQQPRAGHKSLQPTPQKPQ